MDAKFRKQENTANSVTIGLSCKVVLWCSIQDPTLTINSDKSIENVQENCRMSVYFQNISELSNQNVRKFAKGRQTPIKDRFYPKVAPNCAAGCAFLGEKKSAYPVIRSGARAPAGGALSFFFARRLPASDPRLRWCKGTRGEEILQAAVRRPRTRDCSLPSFFYTVCAFA